MKKIIKKIKTRIQNSNSYIINNLKDLNKQKDEMIKLKDKEIEDLILEVNKYKSDARTYSLELDEANKLIESLNKAVILCNDKINELEGVVVNGNTITDAKENV